MKAEIITIGDEILIGQIVNTNSAWMGQQLQELGIAIKQITSISDDAQAIQQTLQQAAQRADLILVTGGLGPTKDDITKHTAAAFFHTELRRDEAVLNHVTQFFISRGRQMLPINEQQADVLANAEVLFNAVGTAPGMWVEQAGKIYVFMPGVPFEMKYLMENCVIPKLTAMGRIQSIVHQHLLVAGIGESYLAEQVADIEASLPAGIKLAYLPTHSLVRLRLSAQGDSLETLQQITQDYADRFATRLGEHVVARSDQRLEQIIVEEFAAKKLQITTCESCTGGSLAAEITSVPGASAMFVGGTVPYSNRLKEDLVGVAPEILAAHGAVSEETVRAMAQGAKARMQADYALATSGIAGPGGGSIEKPVGTIWIAVAGPHETWSRCLQLKNNRETNVARTRQEVLLLLWKLYQKEQHRTLE